MPNRVTTTTTTARSNSEAYSLSFSSFTSFTKTTTTTRTKFVVATPGWRKLDIGPYQVGDEQLEEEEEEEDTRDEIYVQLHRMIELKERYNLLVYEIRRGSNASTKKKKILQEITEELPVAEKMSADELEEAIVRLEERQRLVANTPMTTRPRLRHSRRKRRFTSGSSSSMSSSSILSDSSLTSFTSTSRSSSMKSSSSCEREPPSDHPLNDCLCSSKATSTTTTSTTTGTSSRSSPPLMLTRMQAKLIQELNSSKLCECSFTHESLNTLAEEGTKSKRAKLNHHYSNPLSPPPPQPIPSSSSTLQSNKHQQSAQQQLKQIENIEKTIELSLSPNKSRLILRTNKQEMMSSHSPSSPSSYNNFYRRIN